MATWTRSVKQAFVANNTASNKPYLHVSMCSQPASQVRTKSVVTNVALLFLLLLYLAELGSSQTDLSIRMCPKDISFIPIPAQGIGSVIWPHPQVQLTNISGVQEPWKWICKTVLSIGILRLMVSAPEGLRAGWHLTGKGPFFDPFLHLHPLRDVENSTTICGTIYAKHSF